MQFQETGQGWAIISLSCVRVARTAWTYKTYRKFSETQMHLGSQTEAVSCPPLLSVSDSPAGQRASSCKSLGMLFLSLLYLFHTAEELRPEVQKAFFRAAPISVMYLPIPLICSPWPGANELHLEMVK